MTSRLSRFTIIITFANFIHRFGGVSVKGLAVTSERQGSNPARVQSVPAAPIIIGLVWKDYSDVEEECSYEWRDEGLGYRHQ